MSAVKWLSNWYQSHCNGDWEHEEGIRIYSLDNPGWTIIIGLTDTEVEQVEMPYIIVENSEVDWHSMSITKGVFKASGDLSKLEFLIWKFKEIVEGL
jgi:Immunity protein 53